MSQALAQLAPSNLRAAIGAPPVYERPITPELDTQWDTAASHHALDDSESTTVPNSTAVREIRMEYHPHSGRPTKTCCVDDPSYASRPSTYQPPSKPWLPFFKTREDYMLSEVILEGSLSNDLSKRLIKIFTLCRTGEHASEKLTPFELSRVSVSYKAQQSEFDVHHRALWDWAMDLVHSPQLAPHFHWDAEKTFRCNGESSIRIFNEPWSADVFWDAQAQGLAHARDREALLSSCGLRDVNNVFWHLQNTDPHRALSFDRLHSNNSGLFGHHLWDVFKKQITDPGLQAKVDAQFYDVPRWSGLNHFQEVMNISFTDGTKYEDISKILIFTTHNLIPRTQRNKAGWLLLRVLRSFTIIDLYLSFEEHTQLTITDGRREVMEFGRLMQEYIDATDLTALAEGESPKNWNFPKMHALVHSFDDIEAKGASCNYNTKPNEKLHGPLKTSLLDLVPPPSPLSSGALAGSILRIEHASFVSALIRSQVDEINKIASEAVADEDTAPIHDQEMLSTTTPSVVQAPEVRSKVFIDGHIALRSQQRPEALSSFGDAFHHQLSTWLTGELVALDVQSPHALFSPTDHVVYESKVDQKQYIDLLYCSPRFHGSERRDCVVVHTMNGPIFARLLLIFTASVTNNLYSICMVQPLDLPIGPPRVKDAKLRLHRIRARQDKVELIFA
ncbi:hypothetical protein BJY52DRAFT_1195036 [Lactarius psammicola]|nr:hypothetical protein BJY52DRAFT_1195036 [Lactarius psammicola]